LYIKHIGLLHIKLYYGDGESFQNVLVINNIALLVGVMTPHQDSYRSTTPICPNSSGGCDHHTYRIL